MTSAVRWLLVGGGHAHLEILRRLTVSAPPGGDVVLVSSSDRHHYSGMVPGYLRGTYKEEEISFHLPALARAAGAHFLQAEAVGIDLKRRVVHLEGTEDVPYDFVSFNLGSRLAGDDDPAVNHHAALVKPMSKAVDLNARIRRLAATSAQEPRRAVIVGGGSAGLEVALAVASVLDDAGWARELSIFEASERILSGYSARFLHLAEQVLRSRCIRIETGCRVASVQDKTVELEDGESRPSELTIWLTGPAAPPVFQGSGLATDERGFLLVDESLRSVTDPRVFGVGDCATLAAHPMTPKAGVYSVRQAPVLWKSLLAAIGKRSTPRYHPQRSFLSLLNTGDGKALMRYKGYVAHHRLAWYLKDWIDRRFMTKYQSLY